MNETIDFCLPYNDISTSFLKLHTKDKLKCIQLGMLFLNIGNQTQQVWNNSQWEKKINRLQAEISSSQEKINLLSKQQLEEKKLLSEQIRTSEKLKWESQTNLLNKKNNDLEAKITTIMDKYIDLHKQLTNQYDEKIKSRENFYEAKLTSLQERCDSLQKDYENSLKQSQNSTILGQVGESITYEGLNRLFPNAEIEDCHLTKGRGDFILHQNDFIMMIETKNYTKNVTKPEIQKFYRDFDQNNDFKCALLVSLKSGICSRPDFHLEVRNNKPILFLHNINKNMDNLLLAVRFFKLILQTDHIDLSNKEIIGKLNILTPSIKRNWNSMKQHLQQFNNNLIKLIDEQEHHMKEIFNLLLIKY
ncbi:MAG: hypothetical protein CMF69_12805 [Magnetovibrio sp.]|nr:hypothetical protein [Magnetovibrio sp.]|tara:strand:+ start:1849 stop:2931 length:1083 start_codon:yes stop_codon:yes gene_type:complete